MGWYTDNSGSKTHAVGQKQANAWGLYDMRGNLSEWCNDRGYWDNDLKCDYPSYPSCAVTDPTGPNTGSYRVYRGGDWNDLASYCRSARRKIIVPSVRDSVLGFRLYLSSVR